MAATSNVTRTKDYKSLIALGLDKDQALALLAKREAKKVEPTPEDAVALLAKLGLTVEDVAGVVNAKSEDFEEKDATEVMVEKAGLMFARGRVYLTPTNLEAIARVLKTGTPEIAKTSGKGRTTAVLIKREASGDASVQNLTAAK